MKYLKYRQDFLIEIKTHETSSFNQNITQELILESSLMQNDITWGGSLLGRLINSTIRKATIAYKYTGVQKLINQLKSEMDKFVESGLDDESKEEIKKIEFQTILYEIIAAINRNEPLEVFIGRKPEDGGLVYETIEICKELENFEDKNIVLEKLKSFAEELEKIRPDEEEEETKEREEATEKDYMPFIKSTLDILTSTKSLSVTLKNKIPEKEEKANINYLNIKQEDMTPKALEIYFHDYLFPFQIKAKKENMNTSPGQNTRAGWYREIHKKLNNEFLSNEKLSKEQIKGIWTKVHKQMFPKIKKMNPNPEKERITDSFIFEELNETHARNAYKKIYNYFKSSGISKYISMIEDLIKKAQNDTSKPTGRSWEEANPSMKILMVGKQILANKSTIGSPIEFDILINEDTQSENFNGLTKSISIFSKPILGLRYDVGLIDQMSDISDQIKAFLNAYSEMEKNKPEFTQPKNESILNYDRFKILLEAETVGSEIEKIWHDHFTEEEEKKWGIDAKTLKEKQKEFEDKSIQITANGGGKDSIIRIVNIFGRAYKLFATPVIPSGRPRGRVSQKTFRQYKYIGKGNGGSWNAESMENSGGPWAIKSVYEKWDKGVMSLLEDTKYRQFLANPKFTYEGKEGAGQILMKFMTDMLDENTLGDYDGVRKKLLREYFNIDDSKMEKTRSGSVDNKKVKDAEDPNIPVFMRIDTSIDNNDAKKLINSLLIMKYEDQGNTKLKMMYPIRLQNGYLYCKMSEGKDMLQYLKSKKELKEVPKDDISRSMRSEENFWFGRFKIPFCKINNESDIEDIPFSGTFDMDINNVPVQKKTFKILGVYQLKTTENNITKPVIIKWNEIKTRPAKDKPMDVDEQVKKFTKK